VGTFRSIISKIILAVLFVSSSGATAFADERVLSMDVLGAVGVDASLSVAERYEIRVENKEIKHGIIRNIPTEYTGSDGRAYRTEFQFLSAEIDGRRASVSRTTSRGRVNIRIGDANTILSPGVHTFVITYRTKGWIAFREAFDELNWNVTGNDWTFPIDRAAFRLKLPEGGIVSRTAAYTGRYGAKGGDYAVGPENVVFTTRSLAPGEGFTAAFAWNKGVVTPAPRREIPWFERYREPFFSGAAALFVALYYSLAWLFVGRDPKSKRVIPLYRPPSGMDAGFARYVKGMGYSNDCLAADLIQLAVMGYARFSKDASGDTVISRTEKTVDEEAAAAMPEPLLEILRSLLPAGAKDLALTKKNGKKFKTASFKLKSIYDGMAPEYFRKNTVFSALGLVFFLPFLVASPIATARLLPLLAGGAPVTVWSLILGKIFGGSGGLRQKIARAAGGLFSVLIVAAIMWVALRSHKAMLAGIAVSVALAVFFGRIMSAYTTRGARAMEEIRGLEMYMNAAERYRLPMIYKPEETPRLFEELLPYAFALGCAETWADSFADILERASYVPEWNENYSGGHDWLAFSDGGCGGLSREIGSSISSYDASYGGGSGFDGGGGDFSGGGGGGGGGSGW
jgi:uncharacterized membrane protein YgcG